VPRSEELAQRREVLFSGRVQGVGFRFTARHMAARFPVSGYVQNLADGRVWLVVEGEPSVLERFLAELSDEMDRYLENTRVDTRPATGEFDDFEIRH